MKKKSTFIYILLHALIALMSAASICSKLAAGYSFPSKGFILFYGMSVFILFLYALGWQQILKHVELTAAYSARAGGVIWGLVWGIVIFHEKLTVLRVIGIILVFTGLVIYFSGNKEDKV